MNKLIEHNADLRAEVAAAIWLENGGDAERLLFEATGLFGRNYHRDIEKNEQREIGRGQWTVFQINREGLYDALPEGLFHLSTQQTPDTKKKIDQIRLQRRKEQQARRFFLPLEQEYHHVRLWTERIEQQAHELRAVNAFAEVMRGFWQLPDSLDDTQTLRLLELLPVLSGVSEDLSALGDLMGPLLGDTVRLEWTDAPRLTVESTGPLGQGTLGEDILFGGEVSTYLPAIRLTVGLRHLDQLSDYLPGRTGTQLLDWLVEWFLPAEAEVDIRFDLPGNGSFTVNGPSFGEARLGYSTSL